MSALARFLLYVEIMKIIFSRNRYTPPRCVTVWWGVCLVLLLASPLNAADLTESSAYEIGRAYQMEGAGQAVSGLTRKALSKELEGKIKEWTIDSIEESGGIDAAKSKKVEIKKRLKEKIKKRLPGIVKKVLYEELFLGEFGDEVAEVKEIVGKIEEELNKTFNEQIDEYVGGWYDQAIGQIDEYLKFGAGPIAVQLTDLRGTLNNIIDMNTFEAGFSTALSQAVGNSTASAIQKRMADVLAGRLPPEAVEYLNHGPEKFAEYASKIEANLPANQFENLKKELLHTPLFIIPNGVYGGVLSVSASRHFALAYKGVTVDLYELKRGAEVTKVMIWQLKNKDGLSVDLAAFLDAINIISEKFGVSLSDLGKFGETIKNAKDKLKAIEDKLKEIDGLVMSNINEVGDLLKESVGEIQNELEGFQQSLAGPLIDIYGKTEQHINEIKGEVLNKIPANLHGIPGDWDDFKEQFGIKDGLLGKIGQKSPWDIIQEWAKENGIHDAYIKEKERLRRAADKVNDVVSGALSGAAVEVVDAFGFTDPLGRALGMPDIPANNPSIENPLDPVLLHNGEFYYQVTDLFVPGRGIDFRFTRSYRSRANFKGVLGYNWSHNYEERLVFGGEDVIHIDESGRKFVFKKDFVKSSSNTVYTSPRGIFSELQKINNGYLLTSPDGFRAYFSTAGLLTAKEDRYGNQITFQYNRYGLLVKVIDTIGREYNYTYNKEGKLAYIEDFSGRRILFSFDRYGDLVSVTSPKTFDYPEGKKKRYGYSFGNNNEKLNHNIVRIMDPAGNIYLKNHYGDKGFGFDRVIKQQYGEDGEEMTIHYQPFKPAYLMAYMGRAEDVDRVIIRDRRGFKHEYSHNAFGEMLTERLIHNGEHLILKREYSFEGLINYEIERAGIGYRYFYDNSNPKRPAQGNLKKIVRIDRDGNEEKIAEYWFGENNNRIIKTNTISGITKTIDYSGPVTIKEFSGHTLKVSKYFHNKHGQPVEYVGPEGNKFSLKYDGANLIKDANGNILKYDSVGNVTSVTDALGNTSHYQVNALNQIVGQVSPWPFNYSRGFIFDPNDNISEIIISKDGGGKAIYKYTYTPLDHVNSVSKQVSEGRFRTTSFLYDPEGRLIRESKPEGNQVEYSWGAFGELLSIVGGADSFEQQLTIFHYNNYGDLVSVAGRAGVDVAHDSLGRVKEVVNRLGARQIYTYNKSGQVVRVETKDNKDKIAGKNMFIYDAIGRLKEGGWLAEKDKWITEKYFYNKNDRVTRLIDTNGNEWRYSYNEWGDVVSMVGPKGNKILYSYGPTGKIESSKVVESDGAEIDTYFSHDALRRLVSITDIYGGTSRFKYNSMDALVKKTGPRGFATEYFFDDLGRRTQIITQISSNEYAKTSFEWDGNSRLIGITDANSNRTIYKYDNLDRLIQERFADGLTKEYVYNEADQIVSTKQKDGSTIFSKYNALGNLERREAKGSCQEFFYDSLGRIVSSMDYNNPNDSTDDVEEFYAYDSLSRIKAESINGKWISKLFDNAGNPTITKYPSGKTIYKSYDSIDRLKNIFFEGSSLASFDYKGINRRVSEKYSNGVVSDYERNLLGAVLKRKLGPNTMEYNYYPDGLLQTATRGDEKKEYLYDGMGRLTAIEGEYGWQLDAVGNWLTYNDGGRTQARKYNNMNRPTDISFNNNGSIAEGKRHKYIYDGFGRLTGICDRDGEVVAEYSYDVFNRRIGKRLYKEEKNIEYVYDGFEVIEEYNNGKPAKTFVNGAHIDAPVAEITNGSAEFFHLLNDGSVGFISDSNARFTAEYKYSPYGRQQNDSSIKTYGFSARSYDGESGLYYYRNRYYEPGDGRFISEDPLGYKNSFYAGANWVPNGSRYKSGDYIGMDARRSAWPQRLFRGSSESLSAPEMNLYQYALSSPVNFTDPLGLRVGLTRNGNKIGIEITIETYGPYASEAVNTQIKKGIERRWNGNIGKYTLKTEADVTLRAGRADFDRHSFNVMNAGVSEVNCRGCSSGRLYVNKSTSGYVYPNVDFEQVAAHEAGHFFGLADRYDAGSGYLPQPGWEGNLMACTEYECHLEERNIDEMLEADNKGELNRGLHRYMPSQYTNRRAQKSNTLKAPAFVDYK